jgi:stage II sporulation protein D
LKKEIKYKFILIIVFCLIMISILLLDRMFEKKEAVNTESLTKAEYVRILCLTAFSKEECDRRDKTENFTDSKEWYEKYKKIAEKKGWLRQESDGEDDLKQKITYEDIRYLLEQIGVIAEDGSGAAVIDGKKDGAVVSMEEWNQIYELVRPVLDENGEVKEENTVFLAFPSEEPASSSIYTGLGLYHYEGFSLSSYQYQAVKMYTRGTEIIYVGGNSQEEVSIENVWMRENDSETILFFVDGYEIELPVSNLTGNYSDTIGDIVMKNGQVEKIMIKQDVIKGKVLAVHEDGIEIEGYGKVGYASHFKVYKNYGGLESKTSADILIGYDTTEFITANGAICAAILTRPLTAENIRVLIKTDGFSGIEHSQAVIVPTVNCTIFYGENSVAAAAGEEIVIGADSPYLAEGRCRIEPDISTGKFMLKSVNRGNGNPSYSGKMEIVKSENGVVIINELLLEQYLYAVVPSEMPSSYSLEALKAQAVCARSYAYGYLENSGYPEYGAHVDDSVSYQVYHNTDETPATNQPVDETYGKIMKYNGTVIDAFYFSTSCGSTTDAEIWLNHDEFSYEYLQGKLLREENETLDLTNEETFSAFIKQKDYDSFDASYPWYRWEVNFTAAQISESVNQNLPARIKANAEGVLVKNGTGEYEAKEISTVGTVTKLTVNKRGTGGVIQELIIEGTENTVLVKTEYNIRSLLSPSQVEVIKNDGTNSAGMSILPSAYFTVEMSGEGETLEFKLYGGGYGHGVGMSQNGANTMAENGKSYEEILKFFYQGVEIVSYSEE